MPSDPIQASNVLELWRVQCRLLGISAQDRKPFVLHVACSHATEAKIQAKIRQRFTPGWWEGVLITDIECIGNLHMIENTPLYEVDYD